jgi:hypothetical protein
VKAKKVDPIEVESRIEATSQWEGGEGTGRDWWMGAKLPLRGESGNTVGWLLLITICKFQNS